MSTPPMLVSLLMPMQNSGWQGLLIFGGALIASIALAMYFGTKIAKPVQTLIADAHALAVGVAGHRSRIRSSDEIGSLATALNQMAETVERRNAALADSERRYRFLFDSNPLPMWAWDADTMLLLAVNEAAVEKYGYDRDTFLSLRIVDLLDPTEYARFSGARLPFSESKQSAGTWQHRTASDRLLEMDVITTSSRRLGRASWLSVGIDVTARREAERALARSEEQLRQSQKMEAIGTFAGGISHDFSNLLTGMLGYCDLALAMMSANDPVRPDVSEIRALAVRGTDLSRQILAVSRKQIVQPTVLDPNTVIPGLDRLLRRLMGENIEVSTTLGHDLGTIRIDAAQLEQIMLSLASNARDAMPSGGTLRIATARVSDTEVQTFGLDAQQEWIVVRVTDTGVGMTDAVREHIFEPFFTTKERGKGTGLGLPLAYGMIEQSGGEIRVDSALGHGTTFHLLLPRLGERPTDLAAEEDVPGVLTGEETVLLTEDEDSVRVVATAALERRGYRVLTAADGDSALAISRAFPGRIDVLVTDVVMPGMNGRELAEQLEQMRPGMRVLFMSGYTDDAALLKGVSLDERTFLQKPFTSLDLAKRVRSVLDQSLRVS
ncbi:ATP-binding protein [Gemmatimonas sp.]|uniref:ATP-binding protein n=1 Tax=Gemmatimonas sp. TaxID=1962908 RepID=UPI003561E876